MSNSVDLDQHELLRPFAGHGVRFTGLRGDEALADSPFDPSDKSDKFHVNVKTGAWHDKKTGNGGGLTEFLTAIHDDYQHALTPELRKRLSKHRSLPWEAFAPWNIGWDASHDACTFLICDADGRPCDIRRYTLDDRTMRSTHGCETGLFGIERLSDLPSDATVDIAEGEWDAIALAHLHRVTGQNRLVLGVPGAGTFKKEWAQVLTGRSIAAWYDHDEPGTSGDATAEKRLRARTKSRVYCHWPAEKPIGWDLRDEISAALKEGRPKSCWKRLRSWLRDGPRKQPDAIDGEQSGGLEVLKREWVYAYGTKRFIYVGHNPKQRAFYELDKESFSDRHAELFPTDQRERAAARLMLANGCRKVAQPAYLPNKPQLTTERIRGTDLPVVNLWIPSDVQFKRGDIQRYHDHASFLIPDETARQTFFDWFAFLLRYPERKANWSVFLGGKQGAGKDTFVWPVAQCLGITNYCTPGPTDLESDHNDFLRHAKLVIVDTMRFRGKQNLMDRMKQWIASPPERLRINGKWLVQYDIANLAAFVFMANREDALALDPDDRRFFVYWSPAEPKTKDRYYRTLWDWTRANVGAIGHYFTKEHVLSKAFDPLAPPPMTDAKRTMIRANESPLLQVIRQSIDEGRGPFARELVTMHEVEQHLLTQGSLRAAALTPHAIGAALKELGVVKLEHKQVRVLVGQGKTEKRRHAWAVRKADRYQAMNEKTLTEEYQRQKKRGHYRTARTLRLVRGRRHKA